VDRAVNPGLDRALMRVSPAAFVRTTLPVNPSGLAELDTGRYHSIWLPDHMVSFRPDALWTLERRADQVAQRTTQERLALFRELEVPTASPFSPASLFDDRHLDSVGFSRRWTRHTARCADPVFARCRHRGGARRTRIRRC
jgi:hypothetical protein